MAFIVVVAIYDRREGLAEVLLATLIFGLVGIIAQVGGVRLLEWVTGIDIGRVLAADRIRPQAFVVSAAHVAWGWWWRVAILEFVRGGVRPRTLSGAGPRLVATDVDGTLLDPTTG